MQPTQDVIIHIEELCYQTFSQAFLTVSGYDVAVQDLVSAFAKKDKPNGKLNLITGWVNPGDLTALKHLLSEMDVDATVLFEIESFDSPLMPDKSGVSHDSTTIEELIETADALGTIALNKYEGGKDAEFLGKNSTFQRL